MGDYNHKDAICINGTECEEGQKYDLKPLKTIWYRQIYNEVKKVQKRAVLKAETDNNFIDFISINIGKAKDDDITQVSNICLKYNFAYFIKFKRTNDGNNEI